MKCNYSPCEREISEGEGHFTGEDGKKYCSMFCALMKTAQGSDEPTFKRKPLGPMAFSVERPSKLDNL